MSNGSWYDGCCSEEVVVFVSFVSPTTTVCGSFVGAVGGGVGGGASSVVLQSIVISRGIIVIFIFVSLFVPGLSCSIESSRHIPVIQTKSYRYGTCTDGGIKSYEYTHMYVMYETGYRYLTYTSSIFRYYRYCMRII